MTGLTAERIEELSSMLEELSSIYEFLEGHAEVDGFPDDFIIALGEQTIEVDDDGETIDTPEWPVVDNDNEGSIIPSVVAWTAIVEAYKSRATALVTKLHNAGITELPEPPECLG